MTKRKPLVRVLLKDTMVVDGQRRFFQNNERGRQALMIRRVLSDMARRQLPRLEPIRLEIHPSP